MPLVDALADPARPVFLFGSVPPREGTSEDKAREACAKFAARSAVLATDGFIVYDIQDEASRTSLERPFPFRKTMDPAQYASYFPAVSGKQCIIYKSVVESSMDQLDEWIDSAINKYGHEAFNLVGAPSSAVKYTGPNMEQAAQRLKEKGGARFGCVCIPERQTAKGNEHLNMMRKTKFGADWFITQGIFHSAPLINLIHEYGDLCKAEEIVPKKVVLTFAPCARPKTMTFIKWLGMSVPEEVETQIFASANPVSTCIDILCDLLRTVLVETASSGVPLGINVESLSIFKEEIDGAHQLFQRLQVIMLNTSGSPWAIRWFYVDRPLLFNPNYHEHDASKSFNSLVTASKKKEEEEKKPVAAAAAPTVSVFQGTASSTSGVSCAPEF